MSSARVSVLAVLALLAVAIAAPGASAKTLQRPVISPASPRATDALSVTFRAPANLGRTDRLAVEVLGTTNGACASDVNVTVPRAKVRPGLAVTALVQPNQGGRFAGWCAGAAEVTVARLKPNGSGYPGYAIAGTVARRRITIRHAPGFSPERAFGTQVRIDVLPESTATVTAPGRADRVLGLGGAIDGWIAGKFVLNSDYQVKLGFQPLPNLTPTTNDELYVRSLVPDPLCSSPSIQTGTRVAPDGGSSLTFFRDGHVSGKLVLASDPAVLAGCAGPATGTTSIDLSAVLAVKKLADLTTTGTITGVPVGGGVTGTVTLALHLKVNILD